MSNEDQFTSPENFLLTGATAEGAANQSVWDLKEKIRKCGPEATFDFSPAEIGLLVSDLIESDPMNYRTIRSLEAAFEGNELRTKDVARVLLNKDPWLRNLRNIALDRAFFEKDLCLNLVEDFKDAEINLTLDGIALPAKKRKLYRYRMETEEGWRSARSIPPLVEGKEPSKAEAAFMFFRDLVFNNLVVPTVTPNNEGVGRSKIKMEESRIARALEISQESFSVQAIGRAYRGGAKILKRVDRVSPGNSSSDATTDTERAFKTDLRVIIAGTQNEIFSGLGVGPTRSESYENAVINLEWTELAKK